MGMREALSSAAARRRFLQASMLAVNV